MNKLQRIAVLFSLLVGLSGYNLAHAEHLLMLRSTEPFPETMSLLQETIKKQGYTLSRVQRVDIGLSSSGYKTDKYRVVFFGKDKQIQSLLQSYPQLAPYLPVKIIIYAEQSDTILLALDPDQFEIMYPEVKQRKMFKQWSRDMHTIFDKIRRATQN